MIDFVKLKADFQQIIILVILGVILFNPLYTLLFLAGAFVVKRHRKYFNSYFFLMLVLILYSATIIHSYYDTVTLISNFWEYIYVINPFRTIASVVVAIICMFFDFGSVDYWMVIEEKKKKDKYIKKVDNLSFENHRHTFIAGTTGSGKTQLIEKYIRNSLENNEPVYIISGKASRDKHSLLDDVREMCQYYNRKLYIVSMNPDIEERVPYNPFKNWTVVEIADALCNASRFTEPHYKENLSCWIKAVCECMQMAKAHFCLENIIFFMDFNNFRQLLNQLIKDKKLTDDQITTYLSYEDIADIASSSRARFINILLGEGKEVIGGSDAISAVDACNDSAVLFVDLDSFLYTDFTKIIGAFFISDIRHIVSRGANSAGYKRVIMDELATYVTPEIMPLFSQSRSYNYQIICATQSIADLDEISEIFAERVMENCSQYNILQLNSANDAERVSKIIGTVLDVETTRKSTGVQLHWTADGSKKVVNMFKVTPDEIKELKTLQVLVYDKEKPTTVNRIELKYGWNN